MGRSKLQQELTVTNELLFPVILAPIHVHASLCWYLGLQSHWVLEPFSALHNLPARVVPLFNVHGCASPWSEDVSGSMAVFNGDGRLDRLCATMVMIMESLCGLEHKYIYEIIGHSGESEPGHVQSMFAMSFQIYR